MTSPQPLLAQSPVSAHWQPAPATGWKPTPHHRLLLQAIFAGDTAAIAAWHTWAQQIDIEQLDEGSYWLLPRLYQRLQRLDWVDPRDRANPILQRLKGVYRHVWSRNQMILRGLGEAIQSLHTAHIPVVVMGGAALVAIPGGDVGCRRADDSGIWVPEEALTAALAGLQSLGWQPTQRVSPEQLRSQQTAVGLRRQQETLTLCWRPLPECPALGIAGEDADGTALQLGTTPALALAPTDQLFVCCVQASRWQPRSPVYWLADAADLIQKYSIDWLRLISLGKTHRLTLPLRESLTLLGPLLDHADLNTARQQLQNHPISAFERAEFTAKARPHPLLGQLPPQWFEYRRLVPQPWSQRPSGFAQFLSRRWGLSSPWHIPFHGGKQGLKRLLRFSSASR